MLTVIRQGLGDLWRWLVPKKESVSLIGLPGVSMDAAVPVCEKSPSLVLSVGWIVSSAGWVVSPSWGDPVASQLEA